MNGGTRVRSSIFLLRFITLRHDKNDSKVREKLKILRLKMRLIPNSLDIKAGIMVI